MLVRIARSTLIWVLWLIPWIVLFWAAFGPKGFWAGAALGTLIYLWAWWSAEGLILSRLRARKERSAPALRTLRRSVEGFPERLHPTLYVVPDPRACAWIARGIIGRGSVIVTQGCIELLEESELRAVIRRAVERCIEAGVPFETFCAASASRFLRLAPQSWLRLLGTLGFDPGLADRSRPLSPVTAIPFLFLLPPIVLLLRWSRGLESDGRPDPVLESATQKIRAALRDRLDLGQPGLDPLRVVT